MQHFIWIDATNEQWPLAHSHAYTDAYVHTRRQPVLTYLFGSLSMVWFNINKKKTKTKKNINEKCMQTFVRVWLIGIADTLAVELTNCHIELKSHWPSQINLYKIKIFIGNWLNQTIGSMTPNAFNVKPRPQHLELVRMRKKDYASIIAIRAFTPIYVRSRIHFKAHNMQIANCS